MSAVAITKNDNIERAVEHALSSLSIKELIRDKVVAVKPNDTWASPDDKTGVTQADTLRAVLRYLKRFRPAKLVVSGGAGAAETDEVFRIVGLDAVVDQEGATYVDHNRPPFEEVSLPYAPEADVRGPQQKVVVNKQVLEYDTLVSLAQLKLHETATVTLSLKNIAMSYPAADFYGHPRHNENHEHCFFDDMHSFIASMAARFPIHLAIIAGHPAMVATGPLGGHAVETGLIIASTDPVAADVVGARLLGFGAQGVRHLWEAGKFGLGETSIKNMSFPNMDLKEAIQAFTEAAYGERLTFEHS